MAVIMRAAEAAFNIETVPDVQRLKKVPPVHPDRNLKDPEKIRKNLEAKKTRQIEDASVDFRFGKIICVAFYGNLNDDADESEEVIFDKNERRLLEKFWNLAKHFERFITFNGLEFDIPFILTRSWLMCVKPSVNIDSSRHRIKNHFDIRMALCNWDRFASGTLADYAQLKLDVEVSPITGAEINDLYRAGEFELIKEHCQTHAILIWRLYQSMKGILI